MTRRKWRSRRCNTAPPNVEPLEPRILLSTTYTVDSLDDVVAADGFVTLREALQAANTDTAVHDAPAGSSVDTDEITFDSALFDPNPGTITLGGTQLEITDDLTLTGPGADKLSITGQGNSRVFHVAGGVTAAVSRLTVTGGTLAGNNGGGIFNAGDRCRAWEPLTRCRFNPRPPVGGRFHDRLYTDPIFYRFNPRPPVGGR